MSNAIMSQLNNVNNLTDLCDLIASFLPVSYEKKKKYIYTTNDIERAKLLIKDMNEDLKFIDPCMGSGHILVYAFDVFMQIYVSEGWTEREAAISILKNNLFGLDIDERAYQLSYFALMMSAIWST